MNKILLRLLLVGLFGTAAQSDVIRVEAGAGVWNQDPDGSIRYKNSPSFNARDVGYKDENRLYAWALLKHPLPIIPNIRLEYAAMEFNGISTKAFNYENKNFDPGSSSTLTMDQYDAVLYYNILDNTAWMTVDLGLDIKYIDTNFMANDATDSVNKSDNIVLPMAYGRIRAEIPKTELGIETDVKLTAYKGSKVYEYRIKADYGFDLKPIDLGIEAGYRFQQIDIDHNDFTSLDTAGKIDVSGFYAGVMVRF